MNRSSGAVYNSGDPKIATKRFTQRVNSPNWRIKIQNYRNHLQLGKTLVGGSSAGLSQIVNNNKI